MTTQLQLHQEHVARLRRMSRKPEPAKPVLTLVSSQPEPKKWAEMQIMQWADREPQIKRPPVSIVSRIQQAVAAFYGVTVEDILSPSRKMYLIHPRFVAVYITRQMTGYTTPDIGRRFGGRDHSTILHSLRKVESMLDGDDDFAREIAAIKETV